MASSSNVRVHDPFGVRDDERMPFLRGALDPVEAEACLSGCGAVTRGTLCEIRVTRYKPGRRCLIEYSFAVGDRTETVTTLVGKVRAKGLDDRCYQLLGTLRGMDFHERSEDGVSVPEPVGVIPAFQMWLQHKVAGDPAGVLLNSPSAMTIARRIARASHKLHRTNVPSQRRHTLADEVRILHDRLSAVAHANPKWETRLNRILERCKQIAATIPESQPCGIHRDFYPDQVLVNGDRVYLLDFDLYCEGDPALDVGNFLGHVQEASLRRFGRPDAQGAVESEFIDTYCTLSGDAVRDAVEAYTTLTLVRHIYVSTQITDRQAMTPLLLDLCEQRLKTCGG